MSQRIYTQVFKGNMMFALLKHSPGVIVNSASVILKKTFLNTDRIFERLFERQMIG